MLSWTSAALLLTAAGGANALAWPRRNAQCGDLKWPCCDIPDNDPNGGLCRDDTLMTCWEGTCKRCGTDGMPICAGPTPCTGKNIIPVNDFCTFDNSQAPTPPPAPPPSRRPGKVKGPRRTRRTRSKGPKAPRGTIKPPKPSPPPAPTPPPTAEVDPAPGFMGCGDLKWPCCDIPDNDPNAGTCRDDTLMTCWEGTCKRCGTDGMPACAGPKPCTGEFVVHNDFCTKLWH